MKPSVKPKTYRTYADLVRLHIEPALGTYLLTNLQPQHVRAFLNSKLSTVHPSRKKVDERTVAEPEKALSPRTVKHLLVTLRGALGSAVKDSLVHRNVASLVDPPAISKRPMNVFSAEQARVFLHTIKGHRWEALFTTAIALGYRQGEALGLHQSDVDLENGTLTIRQALQRIDGKLRIIPTKEDKIHTVTLPAVTISALLAHRQRQERERRLAGSLGRIRISSLRPPGEHRSMPAVSFAAFIRSWVWRICPRSGFMISGTVPRHSCLRKV